MCWVMLGLMRSGKALLAWVALGVAGCIPPTPPEQGPSAPDPEPPRASVEPPVMPEPLPGPALEPGSEPPPADKKEKPVEPGISRTNTPTRGTLPKAVIDEKLESAGPEIRACYERALETTPDLAGEVSIDFVVAPDGKVVHAEARDVERPLGDPAAVECILNVIRKLEFPEPKGGRVFLNYPLSFQPPKPER